MQLRWSWSWVSLLAVACGGEDPPRTHEEPAPIEWPEPLRIGDDFYVAASALLTNGDGSGWLGWDSYAAPDFSGSARHLEHFDAEGTFDRSSALELGALFGVVLHPDGALTGFQNACGASELDVCLHHEDASGVVTAAAWPPEAGTVTRYEIDADGNIALEETLSADRRRIVSASAAGDDVYAVTLSGGFGVARLAVDGGTRWTAELLPPVLPPEVPLDAPLEELLRAAELAHQLPTAPVATETGVVVAATAARGSLAALAASRGLDLPLPVDPRCPDVVIATFGAADGAARFFAVPTPECEALPKLTVVGDHAVVATVVKVEKAPEPNDTFQYDVGLTIVDLTSGEAHSHVFGFHEDDIPHSLAPCGSDHVCVAGSTGARSVNTGSTVTFGDGFIVAVSLAGEVGTPWTLHGERHTEILHVGPRPGGVVFFATVNGPITHTADSDPWLGFNEAILGAVSLP